jgi:enoyl-CoA hydratase/carnithine racemase
VAPIDGNVRLSLVAARPGAVLEQNEGARLLDLGDGVALLEFRSKSNTLGSKVLDLLAKSLERVERDGMAGLVIGNDDPKFFSAGADLSESTGAVIAGMWDVIERSIHRFQQSVQSIRYAPFPVVVAPAGMTLGGGSEFTLHADAVQAHAELYMGLVEAGVGLLPGGGGTMELLFRFTKDLEPYEEADPFEAVKRAFKLIATAQTSTSALEARKLGFLRPGVDRVSMNRDRLIADAKRRVLDLAPDYVAPAPRTIRALGKEGMGNLSYALFSFLESGPGDALRRDRRAQHRLRALRRRRAAAHGDRAGHPRPRARGVPQAPRQREDAGAHRVHAQDRQAAEELTDARGSDRFGRPHRGGQGQERRRARARRRDADRHLGARDARGRDARRPRPAPHRRRDVGVRDARGVAGAERGPQRGAQGQLPGRRVGGDHQPLLLLGAAERGERRAGGDERDAGRGGGRRRRDDVAGADERLPHAAPPRAHRELHRHGLHRRARGRALQGEPRGPGRVRRQEPAERRARGAGRRVRRPDRAGARAARDVGGGDEDRRRGHVRPRRAAARPTPRPRRWRSCGRRSSRPAAP